MKSKKKKIKKNKSYKNIAIISVLIVTVFLFYMNEYNKAESYNDKIIYKVDSIEVAAKTDNKIDDWKITLVNYENELPKDYKVELVDIDKYRKFDSRAIDKLNEMMRDIRKAGISNIWVQSSYRSVKDQEYVFNESVNKYIKKGMSRKDAEEETLKFINKPGTSEHNLGLAVDFNNVDENFANLSCYKWLVKNAENYGFILRYPKDKYEITKVKYEPWHWRYVGIEHAKEINKLKFCLEEYIDYLKDEKLI